MALKGNWIDKINGVDENSADDINQVAHAVIEVENSLGQAFGPFVGELYTDGALAADDPDALMVTVGGYDEETRINTINMEAGTLIIDGKVFRLPAVSEEYYRGASASTTVLFGYRYTVSTGDIEAMLWDGYIGMIEQDDGLPLKFSKGLDLIPSRTGDNRDILCAMINIPSGSLEITDDMITDLRGVERFCGYSVSKIPAVDDTLTVAGAAADAKAVGVKVGKLSKAIAAESVKNKMRLVADITLEESVTTLYFDKFADGTAISAKRIFVHIILPAFSDYTQKVVNLYNRFNTEESVDATHIVYRPLHYDASQRRELWYSILATTDGICFSEYGYERKNPPATLQSVLRVVGENSGTTLNSGFPIYDIFLNAYFGVDADGNNVGMVAGTRIQIYAEVA